MSFCYPQIQNTFYLFWVHLILFKQKCLHENSATDGKRYLLNYQPEYKMTHRTCLDTFKCKMRFIRNSFIILYPFFCDHKFCDFSKNYRKCVETYRSPCCYNNNRCIKLLMKSMSSLFAWFCFRKRHVYMCNWFSALRKWTKEKKHNNKTQMASARRNEFYYIFLYDDAVEAYALWNSCFRCEQAMSTKSFTVYFCLTFSGFIT